MCSSFETRTGFKSEADVFPDICHAGIVLHMVLSHKTGVMTKCVPQKKKERQKSFPGSLAELRVEFRHSRVSFQEPHQPQFLLIKSSSRIAHFVSIMACQLQLPLNSTVFLTPKHLTETPVTQPICSHKGPTIKFPTIPFSIFSLLLS